MSFQHHQGDAGNGEDHPDPAFPREGLAQHDPSDKGRQGRSQGHEQHGDTRTDNDKGLEKAEISKDKSDQPREGKEQPGPGRCIPG